MLNMSVELLNICGMATFSISSFVIFRLRSAAGGMSVTQPGIELKPSELEVQSLNHGTTRETPAWCYFFSNIKEKKNWTHTP